MFDDPVHLTIDGAGNGQMLQKKQMASPMKKLFLSEFDTPVHLTINRASRYTRDLRQAVIKKQITMIIQTHGFTYYKIASHFVPLITSSL